MLRRPTSPFPRSLALALMLLCGGCRSAPPAVEPTAAEAPLPRWDGSVRRWGNLRAMLHEGDTAGRVDIASVVTPATHGVGAMEELAGEILISDGEARISKGADGRTLNSTILVTSRAAVPGDRAAFLVTAEVPRWRSIEIDRRLDEKGLEELVRRQLEGTAYARAKVIPLRVEGHFAWEGHVIAGICPHSAPLVAAGAADAGPAPPVEVRATAHSPTTLVGFLSDLPPGEIAHRGTQLHVHALHGWYDDGGQVAHVDSFEIEPGAVLSIPAY